MSLEAKYSKNEIEIFQDILRTLSIGNKIKLRELMHMLSLDQISRFQQFRKDCHHQQHTQKSSSIKP